MSYIKTEWKDREGEGLNKFTERGRDGDTVYLENTPDIINVPGTPFSAEVMNKIEQGIYDAHENWEKHFPIGEVIIQLPNTLAPKEKGLPGEWEIANDRAYQYLIRAAAPPAHTVYAQGASYAAGAYVMYHLKGDDWGYFQSKEALSNVPAQLDPVKWTKLTSGGIDVFQRELHGFEPGSDIQIGGQVQGGVYEGYYVIGIYVYGGKFQRAAGGNSSPFGSGTQNDAQREIWGRVDFYLHAALNVPIASNNYGAFYPGTNLISHYYPEIGGTSITRDNSMFSSSRVVPTADDNRGVNYPVLYWRRYA